MTKWSRRSFSPAALGAFGMATWIVSRLRYPQTAADDGPSQQSGVAVVELFTSEGCSSCPPADENLARIAAGKYSGEVVTLSFHVDYWNGLSWKDPFSRTVYSERQRAYARGAGRNDVYTPQMIVNGTAGFVGSDRALSDKVIAAALAKPARHEVRLEILPAHSQGRRTLRYQIRDRQAAAQEHGIQVAPPMPAGHVLNIAVVTDTESMSVARGENAGRKLSHVSVVRRFDAVNPESSSGNYLLPTSGDAVGRLRVVAYMQSTTTREVSGAATLKL